MRYSKGLPLAAAAVIACACLAKADDFVQALSAIRPLAAFTNELRQRVSAPMVSGFAGQPAGQSVEFKSDKMLGLADLQEGLYGNENWCWERITVDVNARRVYAEFSDQPGAQCRDRGEVKTFICPNASGRGCRWNTLYFHVLRRDAFGYSREAAGDQLLAVFNKVRN